MPPVGFEPTISAGERPQTYTLDRTVTGTGSKATITDDNFYSYPSLHERSFNFLQVTMNPVIYAHQQKNAILEIVALLGCYAAQFGSWLLPTFLDCQSVAF